MRKGVLVVIVAVLALAGMVVYKRTGGESAADASNGAAGAGRSGGPGGGRGNVRPPMPVEFATVKRAPVSEQIVVVGNLIGEATVEVVPRVNGRLQTVTVKLGDPVSKGQIIARVEDREIQEQVRGAEASYQVSQASIRQREADLKLAKTNLDRSRSLFERQLLPQQTYDDTEARYQAALAQVDLARAQFEQAKARLDELKVTLSNTIIMSPVDGFVGKRFLDPGAFASTNAPVASVVDISRVRMVANLVERDVRRVPAGTGANVEVDAFPGEKFRGPGQPHRAGVRSRYPNRRNRSRSAQHRVPAETWHVCAGSADGGSKGRRPHRSAQRGGRRGRQERRLHRREAR